MAEVFDVLSQDHAEVKQMLVQLESSSTAAYRASSSDLAQRKKLVEHLVIVESKHEAVEEMYFWPTIRAKVADGDKLADRAVEQEQEGKEVLDKLDKMDARAPEFENLVVAFGRAARDHIAFEETQAWPALRTVLTAKESADLGRKIEHAKRSAPTRPHPRTPPSPGVLKSVGRAAGIADRARDVATGRK